MACMGHGDSCSLATEKSETAFMKVKYQPIVLYVPFRLKFYIVRIEKNESAGPSTTHNTLSPLRGSSEPEHQSGYPAPPYQWR